MKSLESFCPQSVGQMQGMTGQGSTMHVNSILSPYQPQPAAPGRKRLPLCPSMLRCNLTQWGTASASLHAGSTKALLYATHFGSYSNETVEESIGVIIMNKTAGVLELESGSCCCCSFCCLAKQVSCSFIYLFHLYSDVSIAYFPPVRANPCSSEPRCTHAQQVSSLDSAGNGCIIYYQINILHHSRCQSYVLQGLPEPPCDSYCILYAPYTLPVHIFQLCPCEWALLLPKHPCIPPKL